MKILFYLIIICGFIISTGCSQTIKIEKGYAYERSIVSGVTPIQGVSEDGAIVQKNNRSSKQYLIYVSTKDTSPLEVKEVWINGEKYSAKAEPVNDRPVIVAGDINPPNTSDTLFPSSRLKIWKVNVGSLLAVDSNIDKPISLDSQQVLIGFLSKQKLHYFPIQNIKQTGPIELQ
ncbi:MAG: hypothetical protein ABI683_08885 [Ginsengibacter sp.]